MVSRAHSCSELDRGMSHILFDAKQELPDDIAGLEDHLGLLVLCFLLAKLWLMFVARWVDPQMLAQIIKIYAWLKILFHTF